MVDEAEQEFQLIIDSMANEHGSKSWKDVHPFLEKHFGKTRKSYAFLAPRLMRDAIHWGDVKDRIWPTDAETQNKNHFHLLQGDILDTALVQSLVDQSGNQLVYGQHRPTHRFWLVLSADCDTARAEFIRVAPIVAVTKMDKEFIAAANVTSAKFFPIPRLVGDSEDIAGRYADLGQLFVFDARNGRSALPLRLHSITTAGWHLLNAQLIHLVSRAEQMDESVQLRSYTPPAPSA